jgi:hypothetical protein
VLLEGLGKLKKSSYLIGNGVRVLPACCIVPDDIRQQLRDKKAKYMRIQGYNVKVNVHPLTWWTTVELLYEVTYVLLRVQ